MQQIPNSSNGGRAFYLEVALALELILLSKLKANSLERDYLLEHKTKPYIKHSEY